MTIRVMSVPAAHPYVRALAGPGLTFLADPPVPGAPPEQWWPPQALEPAWIRAHAADLDVLHVHFGTEGRTTAQLGALVAALREAGRPLVYTAHDLQHPHLGDQTHHDEHLALLATHADALLTLTTGAADELRSRLGVEARVIAHPQLAPDAWFARADALRCARPPAGPRIGIHLRAMRANVRPARWLAELAEAVAREPGGELHVFVNDPLGGGTEARAALDAALAPLAGAAVVQIHHRTRPDDDALAEELAGLDVSVLPYAHGTHSGWAELCWDLGVPVLTPRVGHIASQHAEPWWLVAFEPGDPGAAAAALRELLRRPVPAGAAERLALRRAQAAEIRAAHLEVYTAVAAEVAPPILGAAPQA